MKKKNNGLVAKMTKIWEFTKTKGVSIFLVMQILFGVLALTACGNTQLGTDTSSTDSSCSDTADIATSTDSSTNTDAEEKYKNYSQILQTVLTNETYVRLTNLSSVYTSNNLPFSYRNNLYSPIPYGFLEEEGYDLKQLKENHLACQQDLFIVDNDLYIALRVQHQDYSEFLTNYLLKYNLSAQEMKELNSLFTNITAANKTTFVQAPLFVQELSYQKNPEVISETYITKDALNAVEEHLNSKAYVSNMTTATYIKTEFGVNSDDSRVVYHTFLIQNSAQNTIYVTRVKNNFTVAEIKFASLGNFFENINGKSVFVSAKKNAYHLNNEGKAILNETRRTVTTISCHESLYVNINNYDLEHIIEK